MHMDKFSYFKQNHILKFYVDTCLWENILPDHIDETYLLYSLADKQIILMRLTN